MSAFWTFTTRRVQEVSHCWQPKQGNCNVAQNLARTTHIAVNAKN